MADSKQRALHDKKTKSHKFVANNKKRQDDRFRESCEIKEKIELCSKEISTETIHSFSDFPISLRTLKGLTESGFTKPTEIQKYGIALALRGYDVLGAAKTGSGKTLAFLIPVLELLWHNKWSNIAGLGALIISPTRELALQTYEVLRKIGKQHDFSAGLIIGGKDIESEKDRIQNTNIIVCTPGRLLQHFDETPNFRCDDLKILVLDEADRILDLGFAQTMNSIIENLPESRQTMLFSATQTKSVKDLARLSLKSPEYIFVHENSKYTTPKKLIQNLVIVELQDKINFLFSFVKNHLKSKSIVFLSSCKQVKFTYEVFRKLRPGIPLMALYGKQKQLKRVSIYNRFCNTKHALLFATDIAARGLDFPAVNWVVQFDCPENVDTYIHRAGRTARYEKGGQALLMLLPSEVALIGKLEERKIPIHEIKVNPKKMRSIQGKLQAFCAQDQDIKHWAQRSIVSYARSVFLQSEKSIFDVTKLPLDAFATSCGLLAPPKVRFMKKIVKKIGPGNDSIVLNTNLNEKEKLGIEMLTVKNDDASDQAYKRLQGSADDEESDTDDVLVKKTDNLHHEPSGNMNEVNNIKIESLEKRKSKAATKASLAKKVLRKNIKLNTKVTFNEEGEAVLPSIGGKNVDDVDEDISSLQGGIDVEKARMRMKAQDQIDRERERKRIKEKHREIKRKERAERQAAAMGSTVAILGNRFEDDLSENDVPKNYELDKDKACPEDLVVSARKKRKIESGSNINLKSSQNLKSEKDSSLLEDEELALHLLGTS